MNLLLTFWHWADIALGRLSWHLLHQGAWQQPQLQLTTVVLQHHTVDVHLQGEEPPHPGHIMHFEKLVYHLLSGASIRCCVSNQGPHCVLEM